MDSTQIVVGSWLAERDTWRRRNGEPYERIVLDSEKYSFDAAVEAPDARDLALAILRALPEAERTAVRDGVGGMSDEAMMQQVLAQVRYAQGKQDEAVEAWKVCAERLQIAEARVAELEQLLSDALDWVSEWSDLAKAIRDALAAGRGEAQRE